MGVSDNRETKYEAIGANSDFGLLDTANNTDNVVSVLGISPTAGGTIQVQVSAGPNNSNGTEFYYLGALEMSYVPEPGSMALCFFGVVFLGAVRRVSRPS